MFWRFLKSSRKCTPCQIVNTASAARNPGSASTPQNPSASASTSLHTAAAACPMRRPTGSRPAAPATCSRSTRAGPSTAPGVGTWRATSIIRAGRTRKRSSGRRFPIIVYVARRRIKTRGRNHGRLRQGLLLSLHRQEPLPLRQMHGAARRGPGQAARQNQTRETQARQKPSSAATPAARRNPAKALARVLAAVTASVPCIVLRNPKTRSVKRFRRASCASTRL